MDNKLRHAALLELKSIAKREKAKVLILYGEKQIKRNYNRKLFNVFGPVFKVLAKLNNLGKRGCVTLISNEIFILVDKKENLHYAVTTLAHELGHVLTADQCFVAYASGKNENKYEMEELAWYEAEKMLKPFLEKSRKFRLIFNTTAKESLRAYKEHYAINPLARF